jgi:hypothetical protein
MGPKTRRAQRLRRLRGTGRRSDRVLVTWWTSAGSYPWYWYLDATQPDRMHGPILWHICGWTTMPKSSTDWVSGPEFKFFFLLFFQLRFIISRQPFVEAQQPL